MIIDAHVHLSTYHGKGNSLKECRDLLLAEMENNDVNYAIVIPDNKEDDSKIADLDDALELLKQTDNLFLIGSPQIVQRGSSELHKYKRLLEERVIRGIKLFPGHDPYFPTDERCLPYYEVCQDLDVPVIIHTGANSNNSEPAKYNDPQYIIAIAKVYPRLKVVITHYFWPKIEYCYEITKDVPNIYFELGGTADEEVLEKSGGIEKMREVLRKTIHDRPDKVMFGTDWPLCSIRRHIELIQSLNLKGDIQRNIFSENAQKVYKLPINLVSYEN